MTSRGPAQLRAALGAIIAVSASWVIRISASVGQRGARRAVLVLAGLCVVLSLMELVGVLFPKTGSALPASPIISTPIQPTPGNSPRVDINELAAVPLFGAGDADAITAPIDAERSAVLSNLDLWGIEDDAKETRLPLVLRGVVFSAVYENARAIIESQNTQAQYVTGDELPLDEKVSVAKILMDRVVLKNEGNYELLHLFEETASTLASAAPYEDSASVRAEALRRRNQRITQMAEADRSRSFREPESLAQIINIAPVGEGGVIDGYRVSAGHDRAQFDALGFQTDDVVVAVNGVALSDPGKAMELYRVLRSASGAQFEVLREGQRITLRAGVDKSLAQ